MRWSEQQLKEYQTRRMLKDAYFLPDQPIEPDGEILEKTLQTKIERVLTGKAYPYLSFRQSRSVLRICPPGWPDLVIVLPKKRVAWIELKSKTGRRSKGQKELALIFHYLGHEIHEVKTMKRFMEIINQ